LIHSTQPDVEKGNIYIRWATEKDLKWSCKELKQFSIDIDQSWSYDDNDTPNVILSYIKEHFFIIAERVGGPKIGLLTALVCNHPFNPNIKIASEIFWRVSPKHRGTRAGMLLMMEYISWGKKNCDILTMGTQKYSPLREGALEKRDFVFVEKSYIMRIN